jgi:hypothetical protein
MGGPVAVVAVACGAPVPARVGERSQGSWRWGDGRWPPPRLKFKPIRNQTFQISFALKLIFPGSKKLNKNARRLGLSRGTMFVIATFPDLNSNLN